MTSQEGTPPQIYIPTLRKERVSRPLPDGILFLDPGLPSTADAPENFTPGNYPFSRREAARVLEELLAVGEALKLASPQNAAAARRDFSPAALAPGEAFALDRFARRESATPEAPSPLLAAQKVLLLAWDLESRLMEILALRDEVTRAAIPLAKALREPPEDEIGGAASALLPEMPEAAEPDWRLTLSAMAAFLPEKAVLVTAHEGMRTALLEMGMLLPLTEDAAERLTNWPETVKSSLLWAQAPLWCILGHARPPANAPWLENAPEIIVCPPAGKGAV